jgi:hypothetical protein
MNKNTLLIIGGIIVLFTVLVSTCGKDKTTYKLKATESSHSAPVLPSDTVKNIKMYLETSASMRGYINKPGANDSGYCIKEYIPYLITDLGKNFSGPKLYTISFTPREFTQGKNAFVKSLVSGHGVNGGSTHIHKIFNEILARHSDNDISLLISDCILDIGNNESQKEQVKTGLYDILNSKNNVSAILIQYYSEFNADYYYDQTGSGTPYRGYGRVMHKRPLYVWVLGKENLLRNLLAQNIFKGYSNIFTYGLNFDNNLDYKLIPSIKSGKIFISNDNKLTLINKKKSDNVTFGVGLDLSGYPSFMHETEYLKKYIKPADGQKSFLKVKPYTKKEYLQKIDKNDKFREIQSQLASYTHLIELTLSDIRPDIDTEFSFSLFKREAPWINKASISSDLDVDLEDLEKKTYSFNIITDAFKDRYYQDNEEKFFSIKFKKID